jgi:hypothetical protein
MEIPGFFGWLEEDAVLAHLAPTSTPTPALPLIGRGSQADPLSFWGRVRVGVKNKLLSIFQVAVA